MSTVKAARKAGDAADRRRVWYVMTSRMGREPREKKERGTKTRKTDSSTPLRSTQNDKTEGV